jgi:hypothetical protein
MKINSEKKKNVYTTFIYQESHAETDHNEKKKNVFSMRRLFSEDLNLFASFEKIKTRMKKDLTLMNNIISSTTTMRRTYVVLTHDVRLSSVNTFNQKATIEKIVKQNSTLHKNLNILRIT